MTHRIIYVLFICILVLAIALAGCDTTEQAAAPTTIPDSDGDGWTDTQEQLAGTNPYDVDTDDDGYWDSQDSNPLDPNIPIAADTKEPTEVATTVPSATDTTEPTSPPVHVIPQLPCRFHGTVTIDSAPALDGTMITATIEGDVYSASIPDNSMGSYVLQITPTSSKEYTEGAVVTFKVGAIQAATDTFETGGNIELNFSITTPATSPPESTSLNRAPRQPKDMKVYITPDDPIVQAKVDEILDAWWRTLYSDFDALRQWTADHINYRYDSVAHGCPDYWQLPTETISLGTGDCEDFAILFCSLLRAYGVPADSVYVAVGQEPGASNRHAYIVERYTTGQWQAMEPQDGAWQVILWGDAVSFWGDYEEIYCFNDQNYISGWPKHEYPRYVLTGYPLLYTGRVYLEKYLVAGQSYSGTAIEIPPGDTSIWKKWGIELRDPDGNLIFDDDGNSDEYSFNIIPSKTGYYELKLWNKGYGKVVELRALPAGWAFVSGENGSCVAD